MLRSLYAWLIRLHPRPFRERFGDEMLVIFDQAAGEDRSALALSVDAFVSLFRQWLFRPAPRPLATATGAAEVPVFGGVHTAPLSPRVVIAGGIATLALFNGVTFAINRGGTPRLFTAEISNVREQVHARQREVRRWGPDEPAGRMAANATMYVTITVALSSVDKNRDGVLSRTEMAAVPVSLAALDANHDGKLSAAESAPVLLGSRSRLLAPEQIPGAQAPLIAVHLVYRALDDDGDGELSAAEIAASSATLRQLDKDNNGQLTTAELIATGVADQLGLIMRLDRDADGRISISERNAVPAHQFRGALEAADRNEDGFVTGPEIASEIRRRADLNRDGRITPQELREARAAGAFTR